MFGLGVMTVISVMAMMPSLITEQSRWVIVETICYRVDSAPRRARDDCSDRLFGRADDVAVFDQREQCTKTALLVERLVSNIYGHIPPIHSDAVHSLSCKPFRQVERK